MKKAILAAEQYLSQQPSPVLLELNNLNPILDAIYSLRVLVNDHGLAEVRVCQWNGEDLDEMVKWIHPGEVPALCGTQLVVTTSMFWFDNAVDQDGDWERPFRTFPMEVFDFSVRMENATSGQLLVVKPAVMRMMAEEGEIEALAENHGYANFTAV